MKQKKERIIAIVCAILLGTCAIPQYVYANDTTPQETNDTNTSQDTTDQDTTNQDTTDQDTTSQDTTSQDTTDQDTTSQDTTDQDTTNQDTDIEQKDTPENLVSAPSAFLMESSTGTILYEKDADSKRPPASVTKVMTLLLIFDALQSGKIHLNDVVTTSEYAASMGGSQVFLEPGETQTVDTLIKCISVASANDACVTMAEYISGSEEAFVKQMNERAQGLGMKNTHFENCNGLDKEGHVTTARDIALMSRELITRYPKIHDYCMIWMEDITHTTKKGSTQFGLSNTNKLVRHYQYTTGLKTGSTSQAKFCISATAKKDDLEMIAVIMAADDSKLRTKDAIALFSYGFGKCQKYQEKEVKKIPKVTINGGVKEKVAVAQEKPFAYVDTTGASLSEIKRNAETKKNVKAPIHVGDEMGKVTYTLAGKEIGTVKILATEDVDAMNFTYAVFKVVKNYAL